MVRIIAETVAELLQKLLQSLPSVVVLAEQIALQVFMKKGHYF